MTGANLNADYRDSKEKYGNHIGATTTLSPKDYRALACHRNRLTPSKGGMAPYAAYSVASRAHPTS